MNDIKLYNNYVEKNTKSFILFSIIIFLTLIVFIFLKNIHFVLKIILKLGIIIMLCFLLIVNFKIELLSNNEAIYCYKYD